jgi:hypothetical protein
MKTKLILLLIILSNFACSPKEPNTQVESKKVDSSIIEIKKGDTIITFDSLGNVEDTVIFD